MHIPSKGYHIHSLACLLYFMGLGANFSVALGQTPAPNIVVILADDLGFSDLGCYGGEIHTPHLDQLAEQGLRFSQFYNNGRGVSTRTSLLTGLYPHQTGLGHLSNPPDNPRGNDYEFPGYRGYLNPGCLTLAEVLKQSGYQTLMSGKWDMGFHGAERWPLQRGFDHYYGALAEGEMPQSLHTARGLRLMNKEVSAGRSFNPNETFTDYALQFLDATQERKNTPFFLYLSYDSPHSIAPEFTKTPAKYVQQYQKGWDYIRDERLNRMIEMGVIEEEWGMAIRDPHVSAWQELNPKEKEAQVKLMTAYAAQLEDLDRYVGRIMDKLSALGQWENTLLFFLSDNGGVGEGAYSQLYGSGWGQASNTPFAGFERSTHEGGIATPLIVHWPQGIPRRMEGEWTHHWGQVMDIMATCLDIVGTSYPRTTDSNGFQPQGKSMLPVLVGKNKPIHRESLCWEHEGNRAVRIDNWKLVGKYNQAWELYELDKDRTESQNVASAYPEQVKKMQDAYTSFAEKRGVVSWQKVQQLIQERTTRLNAVKSSRDQPNFLFFLADDLSVTDIGCYGNEQIHTPYIDQLAAEGIRFTRAFQPSAMCSPSRHSLYTGLYPVASGAYPNHAYAQTGTRSLAHYLSDLGYRVGLAGKTHIAPVESFPFEYLPGDLDWQAIEAFMKRDTEQPFCLFVCSKEPHTPWNRGNTARYDTMNLELPPTWVDTRETRTAFTQYFAEITYLDNQLGRVLKLLKQHQLEDNTLTFFSSEQGNAFPFAKWTCYEAGLQTALIVRWPGKIIPGSTTNAMVEIVDVAPTLVELAGGEKIPYLNGQSLIPVLKGEATRHKDYVFGIQTSLGIKNGPASYGIRSVRNERYKYILNLSPKVRFTNVITEDPQNPFWPSWVREARTNPIASELVTRYQQRPQVELYDLQRDPHERNNLAEDPIYDEIIAELRENLDAWMKAQGDQGQATELEALKHQKKYLQSKHNR